MKKLFEYGAMLIGIAILLWGVYQYAIFSTLVPGCVCDPRYNCLNYVWAAAVGMAIFSAGFVMCSLDAIREGGTNHD